jgi:uncharacterized protein DUF1016
MQKLPRGGFCARLLVRSCRTRQAGRLTQLQHEQRASSTARRQSPFRRLLNLHCRSPLDVDAACNPRWCAHARSPAEFACRVDGKRARSSISMSHGDSRDARLSVYLRNPCAHRMKQRSITADARRRNRTCRARKQPKGANALTFSALVQTIAKTHSHFTARASLAINVGLTLRNWTVGCHIQEFEQRGEERAKYGAGLFDKLSASLRQSKRIKYHPRELRRCRQFYNAYPQIWGALPPESRELLAFSVPQLVRPPSVDPTSVPVDRLLTALSFSHFVELLDIEDPAKRAFYETEAILGNWTSREIARQIGALLFERTALSRNKRRAVDQVQSI